MDRDCDPISGRYGIKKDVVLTWTESMTRGMAVERQREDVLARYAWAKAEEGKRRGGNDLTKGLNRV